MTQLIEVTFKGNRREFFHWPFDEPPAEKAGIIVETDRGEDFGRVHATGELATRRKAGTTHGKEATGPLRAAVRLANGEEIERARLLREDEDAVRRRAIEKTRAQKLDMKITDTEWQLDRRRLTIYFTAEARIDFRNLVRQLESELSTRVQMWHIGVRDEARRLDGIGRCGRQLCSASWLPDLRPVKSSVAKDQRLSTLNPAQISGSCGRLMCCLRYEHEFYVQQRKRFPKEGRILVTLLGEEKVVSNDIFREQVTLRGPTGESRILALDILNRELGGEYTAPAADVAEDGDDDNMDDTAERRVMADKPSTPQRSSHEKQREHQQRQQQRPERPAQPERTRSRPEGPQQGGAERPPQSRTDRSKPPRTERTQEPRPDRSQQPRADRPQQPRADRPQQPRADRPQQPRADRPLQPRADRPQQPRADRPQQPRADRPQQPADDRPQQGRPERPDRSRNERSARPVPNAPSTPAPDAVTADAGNGAGTADDAAQHRRRRRGRRGGRRSRDGGAPPSSPEGTPPSAPPTAGS